MKLVAAGVTLTFILAGCGASTTAAAPTTTTPATTLSPSSGSALPTSLDARCDDDGVSVSGKSVAATKAGVVVNVSSSAPSGTYLNVSWPRGGFGQAVASTPTTWYAQAPPGDLTLRCSTRTGSKAVVRVTDTAGFWSTTTLSDEGCAPGAIPSWVGGGGSGSTAEAAATDLVTQLSKVGPSPGPFSGKGTSVKRAQGGYPASPVQVWIVSVDGAPYMTAQVSGSGTQFSASPDTLCS